MASIENTKNKIEAAYELLKEETTTVQKFEHVRVLIKGINSTVDEHLKTCSETITKLKNLQEGNVVELSKELIAENTEEEKKRKKILLTFINSWNQLRGEVKFINDKFQDTTQDKEDVLNRQNAFGLARIITSLKGPFGVITIAAILIVATLAYINSRKAQTPVETSSSKPAINVSEKPKIKVIVVDGKQIPLTEIREVTGSECNGELHYHAKSDLGTKALDGTLVHDPNPSTCGFGKVKDLPIEEINYTNPQTDN